MNEHQNPPIDTAADEAADWYARLRGPDVSEIDAARFRAWLADPAHRREFEAVDAFWEDLAGIERSGAVQRVRTEIAERRRRRVLQRLFLRQRSLWAVAATVVVAVGAAFVWQQWQAGRYVTDIGELRTVPLADGSVITLNTATEMRVDYSEDRRQVELVQGQANFEVAKDADRPFVVIAGGGEVRALGTIFDVYESGRKVTVTLIEGKVAVVPNRAAVRQLKRQPEPATVDADAAGERASAPVSQANGIVLAAGEQVTYATAGAVVERVTVDVPRATAWRQRKLDFSDTPILEAIAEANRYSREKIVLRAPELRDARISGIFEAGKNELFVEGLQSYFDLQVEYTDDHRIVLTARGDRH